MLFSVITFAQAQDGRGAGRGMGTPAERAQKNADRLAEKLKLNDDQKAKVSAIYLEQANKMEKLRAEASGNREDMRATMKKSAEESDTKINALLNEDQKKTYAEWKAERMERMKKGGEGKRGPGGAE